MVVGTSRWQSESTTCSLLGAGEDSDGSANRGIVPQDRYRRRDDMVPGLTERERRTADSQWVAWLADGTRRIPRIDRATASGPRQQPVHGSNRHPDRLT